MVDSMFDQPIEDGEERPSDFFKLNLIMLLFLFALGFAERTVYFNNPVEGLYVHAGILVALIIYVSTKWDYSQYRYLLSLAVVPLMRIVSLALPLRYFPLTVWYILVGLILAVSILIFTQRLEITLFNLGINTYFLPLQLLVGLSGILIGVGHYLIYKPTLISLTTTLIQRILLGLVLLICNGFIEELIFRGMLQYTAERLLGRYPAWLYVAVMYSIMTLGSFSLGNVVFTFIISLYFSWIVSRTKSISGVSLAHGLASITLFIIMPGLTL